MSYNSGGPLWGGIQQPQSQTYAQTHPSGGAQQNGGLAGLGQQLQQAAQTDPAGTHALIQQHLATWGGGGNQAAGQTPQQAWAALGNPGGSGNASWAGATPPAASGGQQATWGANPPQATGGGQGLLGTGSGQQFGLPGGGPDAPQAGRGASGPGLPIQTGGGNGAGATGAPDTLGFGTGATSTYFNDDPNAAWQRYVNTLGGQNTSLGRYASRHFGEAYSNFLAAGQKDPTLTMTNWLNQYASTPQMQQQYALASPFARDFYVQPQVAATRYLG